MPQTVTQSAVSVAANATSAEQLSGTLLETAPGNGAARLFAKISATGLNVTHSAGGALVIDDQPVPFTGTAGTIARNENMIIEYGVTGGSRLQLRFRNTTAGALTFDFILDFQEL